MRCGGKEKETTATNKERCGGRARGVEETAVKTGNEAQSSIEKNFKAEYREKLNAELEAMRNKEMWQAGVTVRKLRPENN